jgi:DNA mismatch repair ATPase MutS
VAEQRVLKAERGSNSEGYQLRHKNALLNAKIFELQGTIDVFNSSYNTLKTQYDNVHGHYVKLYNDAKHTVYELERKEHDVNYLKSVMSGTEECK